MTRFHQRQVIAENIKLMTFNFCGAYIRVYDTHEKPNSHRRQINNQYGGLRSDGTSCLGKFECVYRLNYVHIQRYTETLPAFILYRNERVNAQRTNSI